jgi:hypothetical protein
MKRKVQQLWDDVKDYQDLTIADNIKDRLQRTLTRYLEDLESSSDRLRGKKIRTVYKELSK